MRKFIHLKIKYFFSILICVPLFFYYSGHVKAQNILPNINTTAGNEQGIPKEFPWAGGLNACQFCPIDLNLDGKDDLLIFDRHGNRRLTFINHGTPNTIDYSFEPGFAPDLPDLHDWVITADYNCDGKKDIFTYGMGGVRVFLNVSDTSLKFRLVTNLLESYYYNGKVGILVTSVDYPALADIDNDGDLDLLTFFGLGAFVEYHRNLSMEKYGHCDSLDFRLADPCWGKFRESEGGNRIILNVTCRGDQGEQPGEHGQLNPEGSRHTGSTLCAIDLNNDGLKDLLLGDVDFPGIVALYNGGTIDSARIVTQDTLFPSGSAPVHLFSFPALSNLDLDNDGRGDLVISPFDPALHTSENYNCIRFYKNTGSGAMPAFTLFPEQPFLDEMMDFGSASHPVLFDMDGDGLQDLFAGNDGIYDSSWYKNGQLYSAYTSRISFFRNTGTANVPVFTLADVDFAGISSLHLRGAFPAFGDLNGDSRPDMVTGTSDGTLIAFINTGTGTAIPSFETPVFHWQGIDVGNYSTPVLFDLDKDNKADLIIGEQSGNLNWYKNTGSFENPTYTLVTDSLGKINITNYMLSYDGYSTPCFSRGPDGAAFLLTGSEEGRIHLYRNIEQNLYGKFTESAGLFSWLSQTPADSLFGWQTSPAIAHLSDPLEFDMITGNFSGGLNYISKRSQPAIFQGIDEPLAANPGQLLIFPNPADQYITAVITAPGAPPRGSGLSIYDLCGRQVLDVPFPAQTAVSVSALPPGVYIIRLGLFFSKLVITRP